MIVYHYLSFFFFFNDTATTEIYTLSLHDALPILQENLTRRPIDSGVRIGHVHLKVADLERALAFYRDVLGFEVTQRMGRDRKSTRLNSSHGYISYAVFCLKKKKLDYYTNN